MLYLIGGHSRKDTIEFYTQVACAIAFCVFSFVYLYYYQGELLAVAQFVLSGGKTHYGNMVGAILITLTLYLLQCTVMYFTHLRRRAHAFTYFPSLLILTVITDVSPNIDKHFSFGGWLIAFPILIAAYVALVFWLRKIQPYEPEDHNRSVLARTVWINLMTMVLMFFLVGLFSNGNDVFHYRVRMEQLIGKGKYNKALKVGEKSLSTDPSLTMLRVHALVKTGTVGDRLFHYPLAGGKKALLPDGDDTRTMLLPDSVIKAFSATDSAKVHYLLAGCLLDRELDDFVDLIYKAYPDSVMPRHYAEAIILHNYLSGKPYAEGHDPVLETDFKEFCEMEKTYPRHTVANYLRRTYGNTYWYYYKYAK